MKIRPATEDDLDRIVEINNQWTQWWAPRQTDFFRRFLSSPLFYVVEVQGEISGFTLGMSEQATYDNPNFNWFKERYKRFYYLDRTAIDSECTGQKLGSALHTYLFERHYDRPIVCEIDERNQGSIRYHLRKGFGETGRYKRMIMYELRRESHTR